MKRIALVTLAEVVLVLACIIGGAVVVGATSRPARASNCASCATLKAAR